MVERFPRSLLAFLFCDDVLVGEGDLTFFLTTNLSILSCRAALFFVATVLRPCPCLSFFFTDSVTFFFFSVDGGSSSFSSDRFFFLGVGNPVLFVFRRPFFLNERKNHFYKYIIYYRGRVEVTLFDKCSNKVQDFKPKLS